MSSTFFRKLPTPLEIKTMYPVPEAVENRNNSMTKKSERFLQVKVINLL